MNTSYQTRLLLRFQKSEVLLPLQERNGVNITIYSNKMHANYRLTMHSHKDIGLVLLLVRTEDITDIDMQSVPCHEVSRCLLPPEGQKEREESSYTKVDYLLCYSGVFHLW